MLLGVAEFQPTPSHTRLWSPDKLVRSPTQPNLVSPPRSRYTAGSLLPHVPSAGDSLASEEGSMLLYGAADSYCLTTACSGCHRVADGVHPACQ